MTDTGIIFAAGMMVGVILFFIGVISGYLTVCLIAKLCGR